MKLLASLSLILLAGGAAAQEPSSGIAPEQLEFFEKKIRPILVRRCYTCHSRQAEKLKGGLYLDTRDGWTRGGDSGPAIVPGKPEESLLVRAVQYKHDPGMPPKSRLPDPEIRALAEWVRRGAPDPRKGAAPVARVKQTGLSVEEGRAFWAYKPPVEPSLPTVRDAKWPKDEVDGFILARLEAEGLRPAPPADRAALLRRLYYDLAGLPPTPDEVNAFVRDPAPGAYEKVVDRLLKSPHFGERWGRHWLDVARYAESLTLRGFILKEAWRYRDYVIESFNSDVPFDRFVREQVAGDLLPAESLEQRRRQAVAVTFLAMGNTNLEDQNKQQLEVDVVDEQLETLGRAFLAQTIGCARCHDHKFDPIPTRDYYAMAGILKNSRTLEHANVSKWIEVPLPVDPARAAALKKHDDSVAALEGRIKAEKEKVAAAKRAKNPSGVIAVSDVPGLVVDDAEAVKVGEWQHSTWSGNYIGKGYVHDKKEGKGEKSLTYQPELKAGTYEVRFAYSHGGSRATNVPLTLLTAEGEKTVIVDERKSPPIEGRYVSLGRHRFENNQGYVIVSTKGTQGHVTADAVVFIPVDQLGPARTAAPAAKTVKSSASAARIKKLEAELKELRKSGPKREMVMALREEKESRDLPIHVRGNVDTLGETVPRGFLQVAVRGEMPTLPADRSGRRELAEWLAGTENPLTARVFVNRAWHWLFGAGIVRTTGNFGTTGERPSHPELLDFMAVRFIREGWSIKKLIRHLVTSSTYRMSSTVPANAGAKGPENRLFWKMNRRRLDAECIRDTLLQVSGQLKLDRSGPSFPASLNSDYSFRGDDRRRSVYQPVFRNSLPEIFNVFDFANASMSTGRRDVSTVAPQALYLMNSPFVREQARHAAARLLAEPHRDDRARIVRAYRWTLGRAPTAAESGIALRHLPGAEDARSAWAQVFQALFCSVEFRYVN